MIIPVNQNSYEFSEYCSEKLKNVTLYRIQNLFINITYRGILHCYEASKRNITKKLVQFQIEGENADEIVKKLANIEDMSHLLAELLKYPYSEIKVKKNKRNKELIKKGKGFILLAEM